MCRLSIWFGVPNALASRLIHSALGSMPVPPLVPWVNTTASGPTSDRIAARRPATRASASSHEHRSQPGSGAVFGAVLRSGWFTRCGWSWISGAARPLGHVSPPSGCWSSARNETTRPPSTVTTEGQPTPHNEQYVRIAVIEPRSRPAPSADRCCREVADPQARPPPSTDLSVVVPVGAGHRFHRLQRLHRRQLQALRRIRGKLPVDEGVAGLPVQPVGGVRRLGVGGL